MQELTVRIRDHAFDALAIRSRQERRPLCDQAALELENAVLAAGDTPAPSVLRGTGRRPPPGSGRRLQAARAE